MKFLILLILQVNIIFILSDSNSDDDKEYARQERRVKSLACSILANTQYTYVNHTKREIRELLKKHKIIQKAAESHQKIFEFLRALCFKKIETYTANKIIDDISDRKYEILVNEDYAELFLIDPDLNFTKFKNVIKRVNKIMKKIEDEEEKRKKNETLNHTEPNYFKNLKYFTGIGLKTTVGVLISLIIILITTNIFFYWKNRKEKGDIIIEKVDEKTKNNDNKNVENKDKKIKEEKKEQNKKESNKNSTNKENKENNDIVKEKNKK